ncbi:MAG TPA: hypothetical protein VGM90_20430 [Kofleriaceae bacterium]|jgi:hypothetical protein
MERIELKTSVGSRVAIGFLLLLVVMPALALGKVIGLIVSAALLAGFVALCVSLGKRRLVIDDRGITVKGMMSVRRFEWDEVDHYTYWSMDQQMMYAGGQGALGVLLVIAIVAIVRRMRKDKRENRRFGQGRLTLVSRSGQTIKIDARYKDVHPALDRVFGEVHARLRARPEGTSEFAPFKVSASELAHIKKGPLGLSDVEKINVGGARITVKKRGKRFAWVHVPMRKVRNVMLFLEVIAEHGLVVDAKAEVFVPPTVLDKLRAAASRQAAMPQARVVVR